MPKMELIIASTNTNKVYRLRKVIKNITKDVIVRDISKLSISPPKEKGGTQKDNLLIKLNYYYSHTNKNIIVEDDCFEFLIDNKWKKIINVNNFFSNKKGTYQALRKYFSDHHIMKGNLIKYFATKINRRTRIAKVIIPLNIFVNRRKMNKKINILNNFVGPAIFNKTFAEMGILERDNYLSNICIKKIKNLLS